ncbi:MAG TPA: glycosyltransferase family 2 protein [Candidatus Saccharimonadales bacterium]|nr:glycosyltransferase family 2 protein [Candidatus Saccharimonadales bacterium]
MKKEENPILTILLLTYNHENSIAEAIESILEQETSYPYKVWILDDCSTDKTLEICKKYEDGHPKIIKVISQPKNTKRKHILEARKRIKTRYFATLDGDDRWCHKNKIQLAIDTMEKNPEYVMFAHDTLFNYVHTGEQRSLVHDIYKVKLKNPVTFADNPRHLHTSSRVYRRVIDFNKNPIIRDTITFYSFLDKGPLYYHDEIMSVYNYTEEGVWSKLSPAQRATTTDRAQYDCNKKLGYRHDDFFTSRVSKPNILKKMKKLLGKKIGWKFYIIRSILINGAPLKLP